MTHDPALTDALDRMVQRLDAVERKVDALSAFTRLTDRLDRIEAGLEALGHFAERLPVITDAVGTGAAWAWDQAERRGIDPVGAGVRAAELGAELALPHNLDLAERLLAQREKLVKVLDASDQVADADLDTLLNRGAALTGRLAALMRSAEFERLVELSADPGALSVAQQATTAMVEARAGTIEPVGLFAALRQMGDRDVQRAVGFTLQIARRFGQLLGGR